MAAALDDSQLVPLLETLEDSTTSHTEQTDAYLSIANRLSGEDSKDFTVLVGKQFSRLCKAFKTHISHKNSDLNNAALQMLGFCVFNSTIASSISASEVQELLTALNSIAVKASDKNTCTRALWVISKQNFSPEEVGKTVPSIISTLESVLNKDVQSLVIAYEALNVVIRLLEQAPAQMTAESVRWAKLIIPLVVYSAPKVRLRGATALEIGLPLLLQKPQEVSALTEQLMSSKIIADLHKLFTSKNETYVLKLWPLFVKLLGKALHRSGSFINSLLQLEELGFRSASPAIKKIAFIAWKSLIDNFALNSDILCSTKRLKLLMQPLSSIHVRTEALALTKVEVWWYLLMRLGSQLPAHFEQVCLPLIQSALSVDSSSSQATPLRGANQTLTASTPLQKGTFPFGSPTTPKINLNSSLLTSVAFPSVHLLGIEMMLHFLLGPEVVQFASQHKLVLSLEPLQHPLISSSSFFNKHAGTLLNAVQDGFITIGKDASGAVLHAVWKDMIEFVKAAMETGSKKERQGSEVLTYLLQTLKNIIMSDALQVEKCVSLLECTVKGLPQKVLGSAAYQGTPALFLLQLHFHPGLLEHGFTEERFFINFETLVSYVFSGTTSPLAFSESVLNELNQGAELLENKELLWRLWSILINPLTERVNQTNEVNQGDALEHNFSAMHNALMLPIRHIFPIAEFPQPTMKTLMRTWSELYKTFARCAALVTTTDENVCCEELCSRILSGLGDYPLVLPLLERIVQVITVIVDCVNFSPYSTKFQPKTKAPHTPTDWAKKRRGPLGNLNSLLKLIVKLTEGFHVLCSDQCQIEAHAPTLSAIGSSIIGTLSSCINHISIPSVLGAVFTLLTKPISVFYAKTKSDSPKVYSGLGSKLDKLLGDVLFCLGSRYTGSYDNDLLEALSPLLCAIFLHKNKQFRKQAVKFWNGSFAKAATLVYPGDIKPVLSQVKLKTPLLLPGFTFSSAAEESSGPSFDNMENSQLGTKISGIEVKSAGKRDSLLARAEELKDKGTPTKSPMAKLKLDFSSPNTKKKLLEEEQSVDFVVIPTKTKERVLTEHQKEVLRTKRVGIPTMYNNLDASQDTTLFTQYSQSQETSQERTSQTDGPKGNTAESKVENNGQIEKTEATPAKEEAVDVEMLEDDCKDSKSVEDSTVLNASKDTQNVSNISNASTSSDMVSGTPPPPTSRRQSFITLEKFDSSGNLSFSPLAERQFPKVKEVILVPDSQEAMDTTEKESGMVEKTAKPSQTMATKEAQKETSKPVSKRGSRAARVAEDTENKLGVSEEPNQGCTNESVTNASVEMEENDFVPDSQAPLEEKVVGQDTDSVAESTIDSKENTPPEAVNHARSKGPQIPQKVPANQILRRSSRRQSEILESVKNETETEKQAHTKEEQKSGTKKALPTKETPSKQQCEKLVKNQDKDNQDLAKKHQEEDPGTNKTVKNRDVKKEELPDSNSSLESQEMARGRPRYQTRRSLSSQSQVDLLAESDNSETLEGTGKRKRKGRTRSVEKLVKDEKAETSQEIPTETGPQLDMERSVKNLENASVITIIDDSQSELDGKTYTIVSDNQSHSKKSVLEPEGNTELGPTLSTVEANKTYDISKASTEINDTFQSLMTEPTAGDFSTAVSDVFQNSQSTLQSLDCPHKKSRRVRRSKICDCCVASNKQEKSFTELKSEAVDSKDQEMHISSDMQFNDTTFSGPCAVSTPLATEQVFFKPSATEIRSDTESEQDQTTAPLNESNSEVEEQTRVFVPTKTVKSMATSMEPEAEDETVVAESPKEMRTEGACLDRKHQGEVCAEREQMQVGDLNPDTTNYKTFIVQTTEVSASNLVDDKPEEELENAQSVVADEDDVMAEKIDIDAEAGQCISKIEIEETALKVAEENVEVNVQSDEVVNTPADEDKALDVVEENTSLGEESAQTTFAEKTEGETIQTAVMLSDLNTLPDGVEVEEDLPIVAKKCSTPRMSETVVLQNLSDGPSNIDSPPKMKGLSFMVMANDSPSGSFSWSPSASPSTSILKKGLKRQQEVDSPSPVNKIRRVSFANPIYQEGLADDIDRRSPVIRGSSTHSSPSSRSLKMLTSTQPKINTTPTKGFVSPEARALGFKSSKKSLISEMTKESMPSPKESVYPALMNCATPVDVILPQITSNMWARGLGQLIRAKNIKTIGDLSTLTPCEIKTLPIRSPKISTVKKALRIYHQQQTKTKGYDEFAALDEAEKQLNGLDEKSVSADEEKIETDLPEASATAAMEVTPSPDLLSQVNALSLLLTSEELGKYSGSQLFEMQEKLGTMSNCILRHLQSRWRSPPHATLD
ncbi:telomere-associated protein RIF1 isoform X2 [Mixophyes fleayi]|uniref:telomere-associated protein RIF1 isoform X2 n=1 Tax=Mixophyes fleayi TaxID=3061075 RepID=UPI003F4DE08F